MTTLRGLAWDDPRMLIQRDDWQEARHPRDWRGRWADKGSGIGGAAQAYVTSLAGKVKIRELNDYDLPSYERERLDPAFTYTREQRFALDGYADHSFEINETARGGKPDYWRMSPDKARQAADALSSAMQPMPDDLVLLREIKGRAVLDEFEPGDVIADRAFTSSTMVPGRFAAGRDDTTVMHILTPAGTPVAWVGRGEDEILFDRGQPMVIVSKRPRPGRERFVTDVYALVLPRRVAEGG